MFCDETSITVHAGKGGNGCIAFRRERCIAKGGPNGGNGGSGGNIILQVNPHLNSLIELHTKKKFAAKNGTQGSSYLKNGISGEDLIIKVPVGTVVTNTESSEVIADLHSHNMSVVVARGGRGGYGNAHFKSSTRQAPRFAELGEVGEEISLHLELKLVADIGIIGLPSAGKSTLISRISAAKPKIGDFPFTTLVPNLGVVKLSNERSLVVCDIPGIIEGAHEGKGLGDKFLRHITRSKILVHLIDVSHEDLSKDYNTIRNELLKYSPVLAKKKEIVALNKIDLLQQDTELLQMLVQEFSKKTRIPQKNIQILSAVSGEGISELLEIMWKTSQEKVKSITPPVSKHVVLKPHLKAGADDAKNWTITKKKGAFFIEGERLNQIANMTDFENREGIMRLRDVLYKVGVEKELLRMGAEQGSKLHFHHRGQERVLDFTPSLLKKR